jgi:putative tryptophan/tyrosine transport system substrate-binding protein
MAFHLTLPYRCPLPEGEEIPSTPLPDSKIRPEHCWDASFLRHLLCSCVMSVLLLGFSAPVAAQGIALLKSQNLDPFNQAVNGFTTACHERVTQYDLHGSKSEATAIVREVLAAKPRLIVAIGALAAQVAKEEATETPIVFFMVPRPRSYGLQGDNIAGIALDIPVEVQLAIYKSLMPAVKTIGVVFDPEKTKTLVTEAEDVGKKLGVQVLASPVTSQKDVPTALRNIVDKIDLLWMVPDDTVMTPESFQFFLLTAFEHNLPFVAVSDIFVKVGALASLSPDYTDVGRQGCQLVTEIEKNRQRLSEIDVVPPSKVDLTINLKTASKIGLTLPARVVETAHRVYR